MIARHGTGALGDPGWFAATVSCNAACPVGTDAAGYVQAIADGDFDRAYDLARANNPFPSVCGRVCSAPCEGACRRGVVDAPVAIRALKRVAASHAGVETTRSRWPRAHGDLPTVDSASVGIIGGGPAGLAAAYALRLRGCAVAVYERDAELGGMLRYGIPAFRLPRDVLDAEIAALVDTGIGVRTGCAVGVDISYDTLLAGHDALLITAGCSTGRRLPIPGADFTGVTTAVAMLREAAVAIESPVVVIGGGSVAFDAARTARRRGATSVTILAPESRSALPVAVEELHDAEQEGIAVRTAVGVREIRGATPTLRSVAHVVLSPVRSLRDAQGRFRLELDDAQIELAAGCVIFAVGQRTDEGGFAGLPYVAPTSWGGLPSDARGRTPIARVYVAGDLQSGPGDLIDAIASGQRAAGTIAADLDARRGALTMPTSPAATLLSTNTATSIGALASTQGVGGSRYRSDYDRIRRHALPVIDAELRVRDGVREVEGVLSDAVARREATRCLRCNTHVVLDAARCVACGLCVDVCPFSCLSLGGGEEGDYLLSLDERACVRCGLCVDRCPAKALDLARTVA